MEKQMRATLWRLNLILATWALGLETVSAEQSKTGLSIQVSHYDRTFSNPQNNRTQTGLGAILRHTHSLWGKLLTINGAAYHVQKLATNGRIQEDLLTVDGNQLAGFSLLGEASLKLQPTQNFSIEVGRTQHDSLLLKSKTRLLPSTFEGVNLSWQIGKNLTLYAHRFTKWSARANSEFVRFDTELSRSGAINNLVIAGIDSNFRIFKSTSINLNSEYFEAKNYLRKTALRTRLKQNLENHRSIEFEAAILSSNDSGALFVDGANCCLDRSGLNASNQRLGHNGWGTYLEGTYRVGKHSFSIAVTKIGEPWLEDSFAGDHGTTPFPTATFGPELTNQNETVWLTDYKFSLTSGVLTGLSTKLAYASGSNIENSISSDLGTAEERWWYAELRYQSPWIKGLEARARFRDYKSNIIGEVAGVASDRNEIRLDLRYKKTF
jgi:hypothetical protein